MAYDVYSITVLGVVPARMEGQSDLLMSREQAITRTRREDGMDEYSGVAKESGGQLQTYMRIID